MNNFILISVKNNIKRFISKCNKYNIELYDIRYIDKDNIIVKINKNDFKNIKTYNYYSEINIYKKLGLDGFKHKIYTLKYYIIIFILGIILIYFISNIILKINVIHSNKKIRELIYEELNNNGIRKYSYKKNFQTLETIKNKILDNNKDKLEWISITNVGMTYVIRVEERIIDNIIEKDKYCNVISTKEASIKKIYSDAGEILINPNDIVKKDDILISGNITLNEENKGFVCASGKVYGNVWYNTNITLKRKYLKKEYKNKKRLNIVINNKILRNNKYLLFDKKYILNNKFIKIYKELEYKEKEYTYTEKESINKALKEIDKKFKTKINDGKIINKKITNKTINNNEVSLSVFVITEENIGKQIKLNLDELNNNQEQIN